MRVLVVGSLPAARARPRRGVAGRGRRPARRGPHGRGRRADPIATAHRYLSARGLPGCLQLAAMVQASTRSSSSSSPDCRCGPDAGQVRAHRLALSAVLVRPAPGSRCRRPPRDREDLPGGPGGRAAFSVWRRADRIVIGGEDERAEFLAAVGKRAETPGRELNSVRRSLVPMRRLGRGSPRSRPRTCSSSSAGGRRGKGGRSHRLTRRILPVGTVSPAPGIAMTESDVALLGPRRASASPPTWPGVSSRPRTGDRRSGPSSGASASPVAASTRSSTGPGRLADRHSRRRRARLRWRLGIEGGHGQRP